MVLWKLVFYLTSNQREIHSQFVSSITHQLFQSEEIKGISGQLYHLYKGQMSSTWLSYNSHFSLTFGSEVSRLDWLKVKQTLSSQWCRNRFGKYCNRFSFISMGHWLYPNGKYIFHMYLFTQIQLLAIKFISYGSIILNWAQKIQSIQSLELLKIKCTFIIL